MKMGGFFCLKPLIYLKLGGVNFAIMLNLVTFAIQFTLSKVWVFGSRGHIGPTLNQKT